MRFVHSLDDSVLVPIAGGLTAIVAAATALFSGHAFFRGEHQSDTADSHSPISVEVSLVESAVVEDSAFTSDSSLYIDTGHRQDFGSPEGESLCGRVLSKEADVDTMNEQLDTLLQDVRAARGHRRK